MVDCTALGKPRRKFDDISFTERIARVCDEDVRNLGVGLAEASVVGGVTVGDTDSAVHFANGDHGAGFDAVWVLTEGRRLDFCSCDILCC